MNFVHSSIFSSFCKFYFQPLDERMFIYSETKTQKMTPEKEIIQYPSQMHEYKYIEPEERSKIMASTKEVINKSSKVFFYNSFILRRI